MALRGSARRMGSTSENRSTSFSMPTTATWMRGNVETRRAFPSFVTTTSVPVSATATFAPVIPRSACRNSSRSSRRATATRPGISGASFSFTSSEKTSATCSFVRWMAGITMCEGRCPASCTIHSPRSVSLTRRPSRSSRAFRWISSVAIDFDFTTRRTPRSRQSRTTYSRTASGSEVRNTFAPARVACASNSCASASSFPAARPFSATSRSRSPSKEMPSYARAREATYASPNRPSEPASLPSASAPARRSLSRCSFMTGLPARRRRR